MFPTLVGMIVIALPTDTARVNYERLRAAAVWIVADGRGTGWVVDSKRRRIMTNYHVVGDAKEVDLVFPLFENGKLLSERSRYERDFNTLRRRGRVIRRDARCDLALIETDSLPDQARPLALAPSVRPGQPVQLLGNRRDLDTLWNSAEGCVRQVFRNDDGIPWRTERLAKGCRLLALDVPIAEGDSGAPVIDSQGKVVGVTSAVLFQAQRMAAAISVAEVRAFLDEPAEVPKPAAPSLYDRLVRGTVWVQSPTSAHRATGVVIDPIRRLILTTAAAAGPRDRVHVVFPRWKDGAPVAEVAAYQEAARVPAVVMVRDLRRNLAILELGSMPADAAGLPLAATPARPGDNLHAVSNPSGIEALWLYAEARVRQTARVRFAPDKDAADARVLILQSAASGNDSGGPIVNGRGELVAIASGKEGPELQVAYAVDLSEIKEFSAAQKRAMIPESATDRIRRADRFERVHWWAEAEKEILAAIVDLPADVDARLRLPPILLQQDRTKESVTLAKRLLESAPLTADARLRYIIARSHLINNEHALAAKELDAIIAIDSKYAQAFALRSSLHRQAKRLDQALKDSDEAVWLDANLAEAYLQRSRVHAARKDFSKALADIDRAIELDPYNPALLETRADLHVALDDKTKAATDRKAALELRRDNAAR